MSVRYCPRCNATVGPDPLGRCRRCHYPLRVTVPDSYVAARLVVNGAICAAILFGIPMFVIWLAVPK